MTISRQTRLTVGAAVAAVAIVLLSTVLFNISLERAVLLAPVLVIGFGVVAGLVVFWGKIAIMHIRGDDQVPPPRPGGDSGRPGE